MKGRDFLTVELGVAAALLVGLWLWRRAGGAPVVAARFAPEGFAWDGKRGQYVRPDGRGGAEVYARDVFL